MNTHFSSSKVRPPYEYLYSFLRLLPILLYVQSRSHSPNYIYTRSAIKARSIPWITTLVRSGADIEAIMTPSSPNTEMRILMHISLKIPSLRLHRPFGSHCITATSMLDVTIWRLNDAALIGLHRSPDTSRDSLVHFWCEMSHLQSKWSVRHLPRISRHYDMQSCQYTSIEKTPRISYKPFLASVRVRTRSTKSYGRITPRNRRLKLQNCPYLG